MKKWIVGLAVLAYMLAPEAVQAQDAEDGPPETGIVTMSTFKVPMGEDRGKVMEWIERMVAPMERANPNVMAFYVLGHYYGSDSRDMVMVRVYKDLASIEAPCGEPCQTYREENPLPEEGTPEREEMMDLWRTFMKYNGRHSDEIYTARLDLAKN
jgi:hypothetical protein